MTLKILPHQRVNFGIDEQLCSIICLQNGLKMVGIGVTRYLTLNQRPKQKKYFRILFPPINPLCSILCYLLQEKQV